LVADVLGGEDAPMRRLTHEESGRFFVVATYAKNSADAIRETTNKVLVELVALESLKDEFDPSASAGTRSEPPAGTPSRRTEKLGDGSAGLRYARQTSAASTTQSLRASKALTAPRPTTVSPNA
jgi:hypothetical protein